MTNEEHAQRWAKNEAKENGDRQNSKMTKREHIATHILGAAVINNPKGVNRFGTS